VTTEIYIHNIHLSRRALYIYRTGRRQWEFILPAGSGKTVEAAAAAAASAGWVCGCGRKGDAYICKRAPGLSENTKEAPRGPDKQTILYEIKKNK